MRKSWRRCLRRFRRSIRKSQSMVDRTAFPILCRLQWRWTRLVAVTLESCRITGNQQRWWTGMRMKILSTRVNWCVRGMRQDMSPQILRPVRILGKHWCVQVTCSVFRRQASQTPRWKRMLWPDMILRSYKWHRMYVTHRQPMRCFMVFLLTLRIRRRRWSC